MCHYCGLVIIEGCFRCRKEGSALYVVAYVINDQDQFFAVYRILYNALYNFPILFWEWSLLWGIPNKR
mgnify:FL=1